MKLQLYNAKFQFTEEGNFRFQFSFEDENGNKDGVVSSTTLEDIRIGDTPTNVGTQLRLMADVVEGFACDGE